MSDNLRGFYIHGSVAMGCFNPASNDIDMLAEHHIRQQLEEIAYYLGQTTIRYTQANRDQVKTKLTLVGGGEILQM